MLQQKHQNTNTTDIRNFCIIAHIDHGKSTLADRLLEITDTVQKRDLKAQTLDSMELEREKGITIKLKTVRMQYTASNETTYQLNLIDTPGHVDFSYEVSRSLAACEGAILIVDASQGIQAQTVSNIYKALEANLEIIPVLNKIDLASANVEKISQDLETAFGFKKEEILKISAKTGEGVEELLDAVIKRVPPPKMKNFGLKSEVSLPLGESCALIPGLKSGVFPRGINKEKPLRALIFDTFYDEFLGVIAIVKIVDGKVTAEDIKNRLKIEFMATKATSILESIGVMKPSRQETQSLSSGEVGYISTGLKEIKSVRVGDTITFEKDASQVEALAGYKEVKPFVFVSIYPVLNDKFADLRIALEKLALSDAALHFEPENNSALGFGFRCGFLGLLHADIIQERLEREYNLELIATMPTVEYRVKKTNGQEISVKTPPDLPNPTQIESVSEPWILINIVSPSEYIGGIIPLCEGRRGVMREMTYPTPETVIFEYELPLSELVHNFFDELKTVSSGFASIDYDFLDYRKVEVVKLDVLVHGDLVDPLSQVVLKQNATEMGKKLVVKLKEVIPRQQYKVALQAAIGGKIIARETIPAVRKDVLAGIYGGHRERKDKLLDRQKRGKTRMKRFGKVDIPQEAFRQVLRV